MLLAVSLGSPGPALAEAVYEELLHYPDAM